MSQLISEAVSPHVGTFDAARMARGEPGLPQGFDWRGKPYRVIERIATWKYTAREGGGGDLYLRRHYYKLRMDDASIWIVYFTRQAPKSGNPKVRWFLYTIDPPGPDEPDGSEAGL